MSYISWAFEMSSVHTILTRFGTFHPLPYRGSFWCYFHRMLGPCPFWCKDSRRERTPFFRSGGESWQTLYLHRRCATRVARWSLAPPAVTVTFVFVYITTGFLGYFDCLFSLWVLGFSLFCVALRCALGISWFPVVHLLSLYVLKVRILHIHPCSCPRREVRKVGR